MDPTIYPPPILALSHQPNSIFHLLIHQIWPFSFSTPLFFFHFSVLSRNVFIIPIFSFTNPLLHPYPPSISISESAIFLFLSQGELQSSKTESELHNHCHHFSATYYNGNPSLKATRRAHISLQASWHLYPQAPSFTFLHIWEYF